MFNTKRIKALSERIAILRMCIDGLHCRVDKMEKYNSSPKESTALESYIPCSTCKCLIRKEDAVRGKSEIVRKDMAISESCGDRKYGTFIEELVTPYYCHSKDCKPKK